MEIMLSVDGCVWGSVGWVEGEGLNAFRYFTRHFSVLERELLTYSCLLICSSNQAPGRLHNIKS